MAFIARRTELSDPEKKVVRETRKFAWEINNQAVVSGSIKSGSHYWDHWYRVSARGYRIARLERINPFEVLISTELHDIGRLGDDDRRDSELHGQQSAEMAANFVDSLPELAREQKDRILMAIHDHPFLAIKDKEILGFDDDRWPPANLITPDRENPVLYVLQDADRLDGIGPIDPIKIAQYSWRISQTPCPEGIIPLENTSWTIPKILMRHREWADILWTDSAKGIAKPLTRMMDTYIKDYEKQMNRVHAEGRKLDNLLKSEAV